jgi:hypothetical protein
MKTGEAPAEALQLLPAQRRLDAREDLVFFQADVVVEESGELGQLPLEVAAGPSSRCAGLRINGQGGGQMLDAGADVGVLRQHLQNCGLGFERDVTSEGGQQHLFFLPEVQPTGGLPEAEVVAGDAAQRPSSRLAGLRMNGAANEQCLHQGVVVVLAERVQAGVTLHRPRWYKNLF